MASGSALTALGIGVALAGAPGPVQAILLVESARGGVPRGFRALAGVHGTFGLLMVSLALGLSVATPSGLVLRALEVAGGALLLWLAIEGARSAGDLHAAANGRRKAPPEIRGLLAIVLNPGTWLFLAIVASPLLAAAARAGGRAGAMLAAVALVAGAATGDTALVVLGGLGLRKAGARWAVGVRLALAAVLAGLGVWLLIKGIVR